MTPKHSAYAMSVDDLAAHIGRADAPVMVDVCIDEDFAADARLIPGAYRHPFTDIDALAASLLGRNVVVICQKGLKLSQGAAAKLRSHGVSARHLDGGNVAWRDAGLPLVPVDAVPARNEQGCTVWVADEGMGRAILACVWLVRRFVDPRAQVLCVEADQIGNVADRFAALSLCDPEVAHPAADLARRLALAIPALDSVLTLDSDNAGKAISQVFDGMAALHPDPLARIEATLPVLDAIYAAARAASPST